MDPISAAGIALSIVSLALQVFAGCIQEYQMFVQTVDMPKKFEHLRTRLNIEEARLLNWGENVGLVEELLDRPSQALQLNRNLILDILVQVQSAFNACLKIETKFSEIVGGNAGKGEASKSKPKRSFLRKTLAESEFEGLIGKLIGYNDAVWSLLDRHAVQELHLMQQQSNLIMLQLTEKVSELYDITAAMAIRPAGAKIPSLSRSETLVEEQQQHHSTLAALATFKANQLSIENSEPALDELQIYNLDLLQQSDKFESSTLLAYNGRQAWVEWREPIEEDLSPTILLLMEDRVRKLAKLLSQPDKPKEFRAPRCLGYLCDADEADEPRYGFVYEVPSAQEGKSSSEQQMRNLREMFVTTPCPSLTQRMRLAVMIAESLFYLHAVSWLHKGLRSKSIVFFIDADQQQTDLSSPMVSGFDFSRPDLPGEITVRHPSNIYDDLYRHPERLKDASTSTPRSKKSHDVYSLGIILLEIAFWKPIEEVMEIPMAQKSARSSIYKIQERILDRSNRSTVGKQSTMANLEGQVGEVYAKVVRRCVQGGEAIGIVGGARGTEPKKNVEMEVEMQQLFFEEILSKLQKLSV
ncbi:Prion-inhibition and propagation domain containing protein [Hyaloscypha variabilis]